MYTKNSKKYFKKRKSKSLLGLYLSEDIPNFTNHEIPESKMICNICIRELWHDMSKQNELFQRIETEKDFYINSAIQEWRCYV